MKRLRTPLARVLGLAAILAGAPVALLAGLALAGALAATAALAGALAVAAASLLIARLWLGDLAAALALLRGAEAPQRPPVPAPRTPGMDELFAAIEPLVAAHRRLAADLGLARQEIEAVIDRLGDPLLLLDSSRRVVNVNAAARQLLGERLAGRDLGASLRDPEVLAAIDATLAEASPRDVEFTLHVPVERRLLASLRPLAAGLAANARVLVHLRDRTGEMRTERMRADFVANASHELRTPLASLIGYIETLQGPARDDGEARERFLAIMHEQATRMARLVEDLMSLSRIELHEHAPPTGRVALAGLLGRVADALALKAEARGMRIDIDLAAGLADVAGDADELTQLFQNLIDNALKYGRPGTPVRVVGRPGERRGKPHVVVSVEDQGEGIAREHLPRLTERFYRVDTARSRALGGTGLGLAIVKHIASRHRGAIEIESEPGKGSRFSVYLPAAAAGAGAAD
ncbi:MAG: PAS domain-containing protein [Proteobacteria bacterium]|nr:PAS domain-containing protein [Pseudomonadota bacterium]